MSALSELEWLDQEQEAIIKADAPKTQEECRDRWYRCANWWHRRNLAYGDGAGMVKECTARAEKIQETIESIGAYI